MVGTILDSTNHLIFGEKNPTEKGAKKKCKIFYNFVCLLKNPLYICIVVLRHSFFDLLVLSYITPLDYVKVYLICLTYNFSYMELYKNSRLHICYFSLDGKKIDEFNFAIVNKTHFYALLKKYAEFAIKRGAVFSLGLDPGDEFFFCITFRD